ncbi:MAG: glycoside hydrolase family 127 protein [Tannerella sp.]|jgi:DUF1680 family protein|nr:glycoside hydrolase family 127 protein [Tannerella sp.]
MKQLFTIIGAMALLGAMLLLTVSVSAQERHKVEDRFFSLLPNSIRLKGYLENDIQKSIEHWNKGVVPYAAFVDFFRNGKHQFAVGEMWGKAVRSGCMFYRYTQDPELKRIMQQTVEDILTTERSNGSISCEQVNLQPNDGGGDLWERKYVMLAMEEYYDWVHPDPRVLQSLKRQADCIIGQIGYPPKISILEQGWSATGIESSSLLEPFMRLYGMTGESRYLEFANYIVDNGASKGSNIFTQAIDNVLPAEMGLPYQKAYEMTSVFEGLVEYFRATAEPQWKQSAMNYFRNVNEREITVVGNGGGGLAIGGECWSNMAFDQADPEIKRMMETCVGVTWMKYCSQVLRLTGDPAAADAIEKYVYNGLIGAMKPEGDGFSYANLLNGRKVTDEGWGQHFGDLHVTCCNLNGPMGLAYIPFVAVMNSAEGPVINLYNAAEVNMQTPANSPLRLSLETDYPQSGKILVRVEPAKAEKFTLRLRIPAWSSLTSVKVNGAGRKVKAGEYLVLDRQWKAGDRVEISFDMRCRVIDSPYGVSRKGDNRQAVIYGPTVLARDENMDKDYSQPVVIKADKLGLVKVVKTKPMLEGTRMEFIVPTTTGTIRMMDYASVNNWDDSHICTWLPKE